MLQVAYRLRKPTGFHGENYIVVLARLNNFFIPFNCIAKQNKREIAQLTAGLAASMAARFFYSNCSSFL